MLDALWFYPVYAIILVYTLFPIRAQLQLSNVLFFLIYHIAGYRRSTVFSNLARSFPEKSDKEIKKIALAFYHHFSDYILESIAWVRVSKKEAKLRLTYKNPEVLTDLYNRKKSVLLAFGHSGNWECTGNLPLVFPYKALAIYKPLTNKFVNRFFIRLRERFGTETVPMATSLRTIIDYDRKKVPTLTLVLTDQRPLISQIDYWTTFMNQETPVLLGTEKISKKLDFAVVFMHIRKMRRGYYQGEFVLITDNPTETAPFEITERHVRELEKQIREQPYTWLWSHKRWKFKKDQVMRWQTANLRRPGTH
jgi:Kdo2-lipid IVA lauroyltransferase/acyltransferase